ncbi:MAG: hypothetical protein OQK82_00500 [Candidatus Pacearchaeota archaeon]|nr:hypothetical protein [Candidatus Pacearchaeota archaeon]
MNNKKGLSAIILTVIMIGLVLVAVSILWVVVNNLVQEETGGISFENECLKINLDVTKMSCEDDTCEVTVKRTSGGDVIGGIRLVFRNSSGSTGTTIEDVSGNIAELGTIVAEDLYHGLTDELPDTVEITPYFLNENGGAEICSQSKEFQF